MSIETMTKLATTTLGSNTVGVTFSNIPQGYTDLVVRISVRTNGTTTPYLYARFNGSSTDYSNRRIVSDGSAISSSAPSDTYIICGFSNTTDQTANTFSSVNLYIPNYSGNNFKSVSSEAAAENNATAARQTLFASLWSNSSAINSISFTDDGSNSFVTHSTFTLYGVKAARTAVGNSIKAVGGNISFDGTYVVHTFNSSGTFTPSDSLLVDYLVVAGGGGSDIGGGGAGGLRSTVGATGGGGSLESALSLTAGTAYTITVGAGGGVGSNGNNSVFSTITSTGGGAGRGNNTNGNSGGSGGGGGYGTSSGGAASPSGQGYAGGAGAATSGGGGGGAGAVGANSAASNIGGAGGNGAANSISGSSVTYAGGGGGAGSSSGGAGGSGGGGAGSSTTGVNGTANTGGGGGGGWSVAAASGGSGVVVIRYRAVV